MAFLSLYAKVGKKLLIQSPPWVCPADTITTIKDGEEVQTQVCDNTDGEGFNYNF